MDGEQVNDMLNSPTLPSDAGEHAGALADIMRRIPEKWGRWISCDKGWYPLLAELNSKLSFLAPDYEIHQVKEKYGTLRFYWELPYRANETEMQYEVRTLVHGIMEDVVSAAEHKSSVTCENCGEMRKVALRGTGWYKTLCEPCAVELNYPLEEEQA